MKQKNKETYKGARKNEKTIGTMKDQTEIQEEYLYEIDRIESLKTKDIIKYEGKCHLIDDKSKIKILVEEIENS